MPSRTWMACQQPERAPDDDQSFHITGPKNGEPCAGCLAVLDRLIEQDPAEWRSLRSLVAASWVQL